MANLTKKFSIIEVLGSANIVLADLAALLGTNVLKIYGPSTDSGSARQGYTPGVGGTLSVLKPGFGYEVISKTTNWEFPGVRVLYGTNTATPKITSISPDRGLSGTVVTVTGIDLAGVTSADFNGTAVAPSGITNNTATSVKLLVPVGVTTGRVSVTTAGGTVTSASNFTVSSVVKNGVHVVDFGDSTSAYPGETGTPDDTSRLAYVKARFLAAGYTDMTFQRFGLPGWTGELALNSTLENNAQYSAKTSQDGQTALQTCLTSLPANKTVLVRVGFLVNGGEVSAIQAIHEAFKASGKVDYTYAGLALNRNDVNMPNGVPDRLTKNAALIAGVGVFCDGYARVNEIPQLYADDAPNNPRYWQRPDFLGLYGVHRTSAANLLESEAEAQEIARLTGRTLPALVIPTFVSVSQQQDEPSMRFLGGSWNTASVNPQYSFGTGAASGSDTAATEQTVKCFGFRDLTPTANLAGGVQYSANGVVIGTGTQYSIDLPTNAGPLKVIFSKYFGSTLAVQDILLEHAPGTAPGTQLFCDLRQFCDENGVFPAIPVPAVPTLFEFGGLGTNTFYTTSGTHAVGDNGNTSAWGVAVARSKKAIKLANNASTDTILITSYITLGVSSGASVVCGPTALTDTSDSYTDGDHMIYVNNAGEAGILENGSFKKADGTAASGTILAGLQGKVKLSWAIRGTTLTYLVNDAPLGTSIVPVAFDIMFKACFQGNAVLESTGFVADNTADSPYA